MAANRKLQGEIDRLLKKVQEGVDLFNSIWNKVHDTNIANQKEKFELELKREIKKLQRCRDQIKTWLQSSEIKDKKVSASYEQALMDARKLIEREMERFKVYEKETKTKAFSKEGLEQQPKTDPKEKAKSETRNWLNNVVGELESQINYFEADIEGLSVKKGKTRPPRLTHLETSISRHKAHLVKLELILRLLDNDELSPEQVNDVKYFIDDYVERNQDDFEEFSDVDELYSSLTLDKAELLEDMLTVGPPVIVKGVTAASAVSSLKPFGTASPTPVSGNSTQDQVEEIASQVSNSDIAPRTPSSKGIIRPSASSTPICTQATGITSNIPAHTLAGGSTTSPILTGTGSLQGGLDSAAAVVSSSPVNIASSVKEEESTHFHGRQSSPVLAEIGLGKGRGSTVGVPFSQSSNSGPLSSTSVIPSLSGGLGESPAVSDMTKMNILGADEKTESGGIVQPLVSPLSNRMLVSKPIEGTGSAEFNSMDETTIPGGRVFSPSGVPGVQWRPHSASSFQNPNELGQVRGRTEIAPDQREKYLERLQIMQQKGPSNLFGGPHFTGGKQFSAQQQTSLQQQFNSQSSSLPCQGGLGLTVQASALKNPTSSSLQHPNSVLQQSAHHGVVMSTGPNDSDVGHAKFEGQQQQQNQSEDSNMEFTMSSRLGKNLTNEDDLKASYVAGGPGSLAEASRTPLDVDLSQGQPLLSNQPSVTVGLIGRRSASDVGAIGDSLSGSIADSGGIHDQMYNLQMLEAAYSKLPQPEDSERAKTYTPRHPVVTPLSYPQVQAPIVDNPAFWEHLGRLPTSTDTLFYTFYNPQNTYQLHFAARELKKQSWRYHTNLHKWFRRHEEPKVVNDEYEQGKYAYFDIQMPNGWCERIVDNFKFEYCFLEDEPDV